METWKPVLGFEDLYEVSDYGNIRRTARGKLFTADQITQAKQMLEAKSTLKTVAAFMNTSVTTVMSIKHGKTWSGDARYRMLTPRPDTKHYMQIDLVCKGQYTRKRVHRVVWEAFNGPIEGRLEINHKDLNRANNGLNNLELVTHQQNLQHAHAIYTEERKHLPKGSRSGPYGRYDNIKHT